MIFKRVPKWVWWVVAVALAMNLYFFQELVAAELLFALGFGVLMVLIFAIYIAVEAGNKGLGWIEESLKGWGQFARLGVARVEALSKRTFRHQHSGSAQ